jgi:hypothetical protein
MILRLHRLAVAEIDHEVDYFEGIILGQTGLTLQTQASMDGRAFAQSLIALDNNAITAP